MIVQANLPALIAQMQAARMEWEEMDTDHTSFPMRKRAQDRYFALKKLVHEAEAIQHGEPVTNPDNERWRTKAQRHANKTR